MMIHLTLFVWFETGGTKDELLGRGNTQILLHKRIQIEEMVCVCIPKPEERKVDAFSDRNGVQKIV